MIIFFTRNDYVPRTLSLRTRDMRIILLNILIKLILKKCQLFITVLYAASNLRDLERELENSPSDRRNASLPLSNILLAREIFIFGIRVA